jgi:hypothetical protein
MHRWLLLVTTIVLAACSHTGSSGPAWPKDRERADGGESIAPRETSKSVAVVEQDSDDDDDKPAEKPADKPAEKPAAATEAAAAAPSAAPEEPVTTEEIVIEIGPDD